LYSSYPISVSARSIQCPLGSFSPGSNSPPFLRLSEPLCDASPHVFGRISFLSRPLAFLCESFSDRDIDPYIGVFGLLKFGIAFPLIQMVSLPYGFPFFSS